MPRKAKLSITDWGHAQQPDFSIPVPDAKHHDAAAQHYEEAARHHRQAAKLYRFRVPRQGQPSRPPGVRAPSARRARRQRKPPRPTSRIISKILAEAALGVFKGKRRIR